MGNAKNNSQKKIRPSIKKEAIHPVDYNKYKLTFACEDCSHFSSINSVCTLGLITEPHMREFQKKMYSTSGHVMLCRFIEID